MNNLNDIFFAPVANQDLTYDQVLEDVQRYFAENHASTIAEAGEGNAERATTLLKELMVQYMYDVHSVRFQFVYTEEQKEANRRAHTAADEGQALIMAAEVRNSIMEPVMDAIAQNFVCYQYEDTEPAPFGSCQWDLFFWCNDFSNTLHGCGLSGRDYSYFTLNFNENQTVEKRAEVCWRLLQFLEHRCRKNRNLDVAVQYSIWYDHEKIEKDADRMKCLLAGCSCTYGSKDGKFLFDNGIFCFRPKYAKRQLYRVSDSEVLALCWKLGLTDDASDGGPPAAGRCSA